MSAVGVCCEHPSSDHGRECDLYDSCSRREVCLVCPGYAYEDDTPMYPYGKAWHRFKPAPAPVQEQRGEQAQ